LAQIDSDLFARLYPILKKLSAVQTDFLNDCQSILKASELQVLL